MSEDKAVEAAARALAVEWRDLFWDSRKHDAEVAVEAARPIIFEEAQVKTAYSLHLAMHDRARRLEKTDPAAAEALREFSNDVYRDYVGEGGDDVTG